ncbi:DUF924 family protein [Synechococcus sp. UW140]|uniref:DUF924 family protein n=1 Tax=Synechococcus sp. UW140 TaxID=368503 RepID=UPI0031380C2D
MAGQGHQVSGMLDFWFVQSRLRQWFAKDPAFDALLRERFLGLTRRAIAGELDAWNEEPSRGLALSLMAMERGRLEAEDEQARRQFWLMPLMHSEDLVEQEAALPLFERFSDPRTADFARQHRDVIARFGRFPHRNALLGRESSAEELAFLQTPGSRF